MLSEKDKEFIKESLETMYLNKFSIFNYKEDLDKQRDKILNNIKEYKEAKKLILADKIFEDEIRKIIDKL